MGDGFLYISSGHKRRWRQASRDFIIFFSIPLAATLLGLYIVPPTEQVKRGTVWPSWLAVLCVLSKTRAMAVGRLKGSSLFSFSRSSPSHSDANSKECYAGAV